jgi:hypothetical protein
MRGTRRDQRGPSDVCEHAAVLVYLMVRLMHRFVAHRTVRVRRSLRQATVMLSITDSHWFARGKSRIGSPLVAP